MNEETNTVEFVVPPEGIPVPVGSNAYKVWRLALDMPGKIPTRQQVNNALQGD